MVWLVDSGKHLFQMLQVIFIYAYVTKSFHVGCYKSDFVCKHNLLMARSILNAFENNIHKINLNFFLIWFLVGYKNQFKIMKL